MASSTVIQTADVVVDRSNLCLVCALSSDDETGTGGDTGADSTEEAADRSVAQPDISTAERAGGDDSAAAAGTINDLHFAAGASTPE